jgi:hypothetical protein
LGEQACQAIVGPVVPAFGCGLGAQAAAISSAARTPAVQGRGCAFRAALWQSGD